MRRIKSSDSTRTWIAKELPEDAEVVLILLPLGGVHVCQGVVDDLADDLEEGVLVADQAGEDGRAVDGQVLPEGQAVHGVIRRGLRHTEGGIFSFKASGIFLFLHVPNVGDRDKNRSEYIHHVTLEHRQ